MVDDFTLMKQGICPVCRQPMIKNGKRTHSKRKSKICLGIMRQRHGLKKPQVEIDGKLYDINVSLKKPQVEVSSSTKDG